jgi:hypothetical protein
VHGTFVPKNFNVTHFTSLHFKIKSLDIGKFRHFVLKNGESESPCSIPILSAILLFLFSPFRHPFTAVCVYSFRSAFHLEVLLKRTTNTVYLFCACVICIPCKRNRARNGEPAISFCNDQWIIYVRL